MKNEPTQFLPIEKFWEEDRKRADAQATTLAAGMVLGSLLTWLLVILFT